MATFQSKRASRRSFALRSTGPAVIICCLTALARPTLPATITDLGTLGGNYSQAFGINASGQVVGYSVTAGSSTAGASQDAFLYSGGTMTDLGTLPGGSESIAYGINASGQIVGDSITASTGYWHAFLYSDGTMTDLGPGGANAINDSGQAVGGLGSDLLFAFSYWNGITTDIGVFFTGTYADASEAEGINASGQVMGFLQFTPYATHAFLYSGGHMTDLGTLGESNSVAKGINAGGQVVGYAYTAGQAELAFLYSDGTMTDLGPGAAYGINDSGQIVGGESNGDAFLYSNGSMIDLNSLLPAGSGWQLEDATAINDSGQIVGYGTIGGQTHAFLMDTSQAANTPEPGSLALLGAGLVAIGLRRWLRPGRLRS
jgi:probable HAF family extracellular repeat protein